MLYCRCEYWEDVFATDIEELKVSKVGIASVLLLLL